ncbi:MAG TPA: tetratricopeptide repeat protein [Terriglobales bacterium]|nr:tetratricopeptide repeat protein [Terriglobales bacterium]
MATLPNQPPALPPESDSSYLRLVWTLAILLTLGAAILYAPAVRNGFVNYDDPDYVTANAHVLQGITWHNLIWAFGTNNPAANWHPLTWISHMLDIQLFHLNPAGHHFTNIVFQAVDVGLLFLFLQWVTGRPFRSAAVAAFFAAHPLNVEAVAWIAERKSVLCVFFMLFAMLSYVWYAKKPGVARYACVLLLFACALMSKVMVITLPFCLLLLDYWPLERFAGAEMSSESSFPWKRAFGLVAEKIPLFFLAALAGWITLLIHHKDKALAAGMPLPWRLKNAVYSYVVYLGKAIWPSNLAVFYPHPENGLSWAAVAISAIILAAISAAVWRYRSRKYLVFGWLWFLGTMFPMIGVVQSGRQGMADRYAYVPLIGIFIAVIWLLGETAVRMKLKEGIVLVAFAVVLFSYLCVTEIQIGYWKNSYTLFAHALAATKNNGIAENNFGAALMARGEPQLAEPHFLAAVQLVPDEASAHYNLGLALQLQSRWNEAAIEYEQAIPLFSDPFEEEHAHHNLAVIYANQKKYGMALTQLDKAIALNPGVRNNYTLRGKIERQSWNYDAAAGDFLRALQIAPSPDVYFELGQAFEAKGDSAGASNAYLSALRLDPGMSQARARLEALLNKVGKR